MLKGGTDGRCDRTVDKLSLCNQFQLRAVEDKKPGEARPDVRDVCEPSVIDARNCEEFRLAPKSTALLPTACRGE